MRIELTADELARAAAVASLNFIRARLRRAKGRANQPEPFGINDLYRGYTGETAVSKWLGLEWPQPHLVIDEPTRAGSDIRWQGLKLEVRTSGARTCRPYLWANPQPQDDPSRPFIGVSMPKEGREQDRAWFDIHGWMWGHEIMKQEYWFDPSKGKNRWVFWYPMDQTRPLEALLELGMES